MEQSKIRKPAVAGQFYLSSAKALKEQVGVLIDKDQDKLDVIACMLPHAGYMYSGSVAGQTVSRINIKDKVILLGPNHRGLGPAYSIMPEGSWQTPLGEIRIDSDLAKEISSASKYLKPDSTAHTYEHSLEVELPFLQYFKSDFEIVPILLLSDDFNILKGMGEEIANAIKKCGLSDLTMLLASSDMTHYEPQDVAEKKDKEAINAILDLDEERLIRKIKELEISMCGYAPVVTMLSAAKLLGAKKAKLIKYQTSGDVIGDKGSVVGYAGIIIN